MTSMKSTTFRTDIEGLRAVAVLMVLFFHAGLPPKGGYVGVDIFFVISGYLITGLLVREAATTGTVSLRRFYAKRAKRLLPAASVVLLVSAALSFLWAPASQRGSFGLDIVGAAAYFANWRFAASSVDYLAEDVGRSPVLHFWSLAVEEQFYFVWPILMLVVLRLWKGKLKRFSIESVLAGALALVLVPSFLWSVRFTETSPTEAFFVTSTRLWELAVGALLALGSPRLQKLPRRLSGLFTVVGAILLGLSGWVFDGDTAWPGHLALLPTVGTALIISGGTLNRHGLGYKILSTPPLVWIGALSYSLYLWHWPFVVLGQDWLELVGTAWGAAIVAAAFVPAWLSYRFIERPLRTSRELSGRPGLALSLGGNLSLVSAVSGLALAASLTLGDGASSKEDEIINLVVRGDRVQASPRNLGAGALGANPTKGRAGRPQKVFQVIRPNPVMATDDVPRAYGEGCQARRNATEPIWCDIGDPEGKVEAVVLGDSKILQYYEALDVVGQSLGWKIRVGTMSSCPFAEALLQKNGKFRWDCAAFRDSVMEQLQDSPPDVVITSQYAPRGILHERTGADALQPPDQPDRGGTRKEMIKGLVQVWTKLDSLGAAILVVLDNPRPPKSVMPIYDCLLQHPRDQTQCAFDRDRGRRSSAEGVQREAAKRFPRAQIVDLGDYICPAEKCAPVIGDILVYRQSTHLTNTYARSLAPVLERKLERAYKEAKKR